MNIIYVCGNSHTTITTDHGAPVITPMIITCTQCPEVAVKAPEEPWHADVEAEYEWYIPVKRRGITKEENRLYRKHGIYLRGILNVQK